MGFFTGKTVLVTGGGYAVLSDGRCEIGRASCRERV